MEEKTSSPSPLKLKAEDPQDLSIISTFLQDALVPFIGMKYDPSMRQFCMLTHRFRWEENPIVQKGVSFYERIQSFFHVHHVTDVKTLGIKDPHNPHQTLNLLSITHKDNHIVLTFSGDVHVQLNVEKISAHMGDDSTVSWPTSLKPHHPE